MNAHKEEDDAPDDPDHCAWVQLDSPASGPPSGPSSGTPGTPTAGGTPTCRTAGTDELLDELLDELGQLRASIVRLHAQVSARADLEDEMAWCLTHRATALTTDTVVSTDPDAFGAPAVPVPPDDIPWHGRGQANDFADAFFEATLRRADADPACRRLSPTDVVYPSGELRRIGPYLWARLRGPRWALVGLDLWPRLRDDGCVPRLFDLVRPLGIVRATDADASARADATIGPNPYPGICPCSAW
jgi:hypothetical protein